VDDLRTIVEYHEQVLRSIENQLGQVVANLDVMRKERDEDRAEAKQQQEQAMQRQEQAMQRQERAMQRQDEDYRRAQERMVHSERYLQRAFRLGVAALRRERTARQEADQKLAEQREADRREWLERHARIELLLEKSIRGGNGSHAQP
jgi:hypothetical protein